MARFSGKAAVVTGAASGIGSAVARRLAAEGASLVVMDLAAAAAEPAFIPGWHHLVDDGYTAQ